MKLAFEFYSDFKRWKEIAKLNPGKYGEDFALKVGTRIRLKKPLKPASYPKGLPYLIKEDDCLSKISKKVYGRGFYWPTIYKNNPDQIKDPHQIFAGFTLFYPKTPQKLGKIDREIY